VRSSLAGLRQRSVSKSEGEDLTEQSDQDRARELTDESLCGFLERERRDVV